MHLHHHLNIVQSFSLYFHSCLSRIWSIAYIETGQKDSHTHQKHDGARTNDQVYRRLWKEGGEGFESIERCERKAREGEAVVAELEGALLRSREVFAYYMLVAFEAGSPLRGLLLLAIWPLIWAARWAVNEGMALRMLTFVATAGLRESEVAGVGRAVLSRFFLDDLHLLAYTAFLSCTGTRCVITSLPGLFVEPFLNHYLGSQIVISSELRIFRGYCTGLLSSSPLLRGGGASLSDAFRGGASLSDAVLRACPPPSAAQHQPIANLGLASSSSSSAFSILSLCKEGFVVGKEKAADGRVDKKQYRKPLIFHDGRLVMRPTPLVSLFLYLWLPLGFALAIARLTIWCLLPAEISLPMSALMGVRLRVYGCPPISPPPSFNCHHHPIRRGILYVCTHRTLLDPIFLSVALRRPITAVTYSLSRLSELLSPIKTFRLSRSRDADAHTIDSLLRQDDLIICPEGTTCREPYLLRFSPLFAEITHDIVPVGISVRMTVFHGTTARGLKAMDPFFFLMNPRPTCSVTILNPLPPEEACSSGRTSVQVANRIQRLMGDVMGYECTNLTRKDKYRVLAGNDGVVPTSSPSPAAAVKPAELLPKESIDKDDKGDGGQCASSSMYCSIRLQFLQLVGKSRS